MSRGIVVYICQSFDKKLHVLLVIGTQRRTLVESRTLLDQSKGIIGVLL